MLTCPRCQSQLLRCGREFVCRSPDCTFVGTVQDGKPVDALAPTQISRNNHRGKRCANRGCRIRVHDDGDYCPKCRRVQP